MNFGGENSYIYWNRYLQLKNTCSWKFQRHQLKSSITVLKLLENLIKFSIGNNFSIKMVKWRTWKWPTKVQKKCGRKGFLKNDQVEKKTFPPLETIIKEWFEKISILSNISFVSRLFKESPCLNVFFEL